MRLRSLPDPSRIPMPAIQYPDLKGKACLVTGGSTGIGAAIVRALGAQGARVAIHCNASRDKAEALAAELRSDGIEAAIVQADLLEPHAPGRIVAEVERAFGRLDVLINNAGHPIARRPIHEIDADFFDQVTDLNYRALFFACRAALPLMRRQGAGAIVNTTSIAARNGGGIGLAPYAAAKAAVMSLTKSLAKEYAQEGIRANAVAPGVIWTGIHEQLTDEAMAEGMKAAIPMRRFGTAEDCVGAYLYLASAEASGYVTGAVIEVNGGSMMP